VAAAFAYAVYTMRNIPLDAIPARTLKMLDRSVAQLKRGRASAPIDLTPFLKD